MDEATRKRLVALTFSEAQELLPRLEVLSERLARPGDAEACTEFGRLAHTLKGSAGAVGLGALAELMHGLEQVALDLEPRVGTERVGTHRLMGRLLRALQATIDEAVLLGAHELSPAALEALQALLASTLKRPAAPAPQPPAPPPPPARPDTATVPGAPIARALELPSGEDASARSLERLSLSAEEVDRALSLAAAISRMAAALDEEHSRAGTPWVNALQELAVRANRLESSLFGMRLVPVEEALRGLESEARRLAERLGKQVRLEVTGEEVRADRRTLEAARSLLRHLVRNALDHGIEPPGEREARGKPPVGHLSVAISMVENRLRVVTTDDGAGFDVGAIRLRLAASGRPDEVSRLSDDEVVQRFAEQGGSTRAQATEVSGRGMGLSAVASATRAQGGDFVVRSTPGQGAQVAFSLPLEVFATDVLIATAGSAHYGLPLASVDRTLFLGDRKLLQHGPNGMTLAVDERIVPVYLLGEVTGSSPGAPRFALVLRVDGREAAFAVDDLGETTRVVPRAVPPAITAETLVTGLAQLPDGAVLQLLNVRRLMEQRTTAATPAQAAGRRRQLEVLLAEDSLATREVLRVLLEEEGHRVRVAGDGEEALQRIDEKVPDVLVSDINMPRLDGISLTRALRERKLPKRLPIVLLTSQDDAEARKAGAAAGADAYLIKARFNAAVLRETLTRLGFDV